MSINVGSLFLLSGPDNETYMFDDHESDLCPVCGYRRDFLRHNPSYTPKRRMGDFSATYDGFDIVSLGFRECAEGKLEGVAFDEFEVTKETKELLSI